MVYWGVLAVIVGLLYFVFSDGHFSIIFTLAGTVQTFGFALIVIKIRRSRSVTGISKECFISYTVVFGVRFLVFMFYRVRVSTVRVTCPVTPLATLSSRPRNSWPPRSQLTFSTASRSSSAPVTTTTSTLSSLSTSSSPPPSSPWSSTHPSTAPSSGTICGPSPSTWKPSQSSVSSCFSATRYFLLNSERRH